MRGLLRQITTRRTEPDFGNLAGFTTDAIPFAEGHPNFGEGFLEKISSEVVYTSKKLPRKESIAQNIWEVLGGLEEEGKASTKLYRVLKAVHKKIS